jgi:hypothetical protein
MYMSHHASIRSQQRGISDMLIDLLWKFGAYEAAGDGAYKLFFDKTARRRVKTYAGPLARLLDEHLDLYAVVASDSKIITTGYRTERIHRR